MQGEGVSLFSLNWLINLFYSSSHTEIDDMIRKSTNLLLTRTLSGCLSSLIKKPNLSLLQVCYIFLKFLCVTIYSELHLGYFPDLAFSRREPIICWVNNGSVVGPS